MGGKLNSLYHKLINNVKQQPHMSELQLRLRLCNSHVIHQNNKYILINFIKMNSLFGRHWLPQKQNSPSAATAIKRVAPVKPLRNSNYQNKKKAFLISFSDPRPHKTKTMHTNERNACIHKHIIYFSRFERQLSVALDTS